MSNDIEKIQQETGIQDLKTLDQDKLDKVMDAVNSKKITAEDLKKLIEMFPSEFLASLGLATQGIKTSLDQASSAQMENLKGTTVTQIQVINSVTDSLRTIEETIRLLATQTQSDSFKSEVAKVLMELAKYKLEIAKILQSINDANNNNRLETQRENNNFFAGMAGGILTFLGFVIWASTGGKTPPPSPPRI
ncbi:hypothetical protein [Nostoc sp. TCL26-01]|uniref:hypothetical protein n=1 Tax=Nostoc sp. TCL26-01 TaxID=2576904 RepID=UPI0015C0E161|nr:hypothetical protein [Nostoc sp. TCL26-01]QLE57115.1 hypothetical protein FD725_17255 [Nostoc sp. TCL26-01]